jgi:hypothetical protein
MHNAVRTIFAQIPQRGTIMPQGGDGPLTPDSKKKSRAQSATDHQQWVDKLSAEIARIDGRIVLWPDYNGPQLGTLGITPWDQTTYPGQQTLLVNIRQALADFQGVTPRDGGPPSVQFPAAGTSNMHPHLMMKRYLDQVWVEAQRRLKNPPNPGQVPPDPGNPPYDWAPNPPPNPPPKYKKWADYTLWHFVQSTKLVGLHQSIPAQQINTFNPSLTTYWDDEVMGTLLAVAVQMYTWAA